MFDDDTEGMMNNFHFYLLSFNFTQCQSDSQVTSNSFHNNENKKETFSSNTTVLSVY